MGKEIVAFRDVLINSELMSHPLAQQEVLEEFGDRVTEMVTLLRESGLGVPAVLDRLQALLEGGSRMDERQRVLDESNIPMAQSGAFVKRGGLVRVHTDEAILTPEQRWGEGSRDTGSSGGGGGGDSYYNFTFPIQAIDATDMEYAIEHKILPKFVDALEQDSRGLRRNVQKALDVEQT